MPRRIHSDRPRGVLLPSSNKVDEDVVGDPCCITQTVPSSGEIMVVWKSVDCNVMRAERSIEQNRQGIQLLTMSTTFQDNQAERYYSSSLCEMLHRPSKSNSSWIEVLSTLFHMKSLNEMQGESLKS